MEDATPMSIPPPVFQADPELISQLLRKIYDNPELSHPLVSLLSAVVTNLRCPSITRTLLSFSDKTMLHLAITLGQGMTQAKGSATKDPPLAVTSPLFQSLTDFMPDDDEGEALSRERSRQVHKACLARDNNVCLLSRDRDIHVCHILPVTATLSRAWGSSYWLLICTLFGKAQGHALRTQLRQDTVQNTVLLTGNWHASWDRGAFNLAPVPDAPDTADFLDLIFYPAAPDFNWATRPTVVPVAPEEQNPHREKLLANGRAVVKGDCFRVHAGNGIPLPSAHFFKLRHILYDVLRAANALKCYQADFTSLYLSQFRPGQDPESDADGEDEGGNDSSERTSGTKRKHGGQGRAPQKKKPRTVGTGREHGRRPDNNYYQSVDECLKEILIEGYERQRQTDALLDYLVMQMEEEFNDRDRNEEDGEMEGEAEGDETEEELNNDDDEDISDNTLHSHESEP
ncbi:hypothetical protein EX30DRAFT_367033 [Ascodesmis nigricans]|uniref:Uncharacterized protein n=1 Tax=Ascodesmis nigricans TaxID=341454 RepID=A0A4S2MJ27_9PEZI|nr:hypothetical protein EX30DRAFT_367033 [Ascodesmis nigricans]